MKVIAFNGSPKKEGNTYHAIRMVAEELEEEGIRLLEDALPAMVV